MQSRTSHWPGPERYPRFIPAARINRMQVKLRQPRSLTLCTVRSSPEYEGMCAEMKPIQKPRGRRAIKEPNDGAGGRQSSKVVPHTSRGDAITDLRKQCIEWNMDMIETRYRESHVASNIAQRCRPQCFLPLRVATVEPEVLLSKLKMPSTVPCDWVFDQCQLQLLALAFFLRVPGTTDFEAEYDVGRLYFVMVWSKLMLGVDPTVQTQNTSLASFLILTLLVVAPTERDIRIINVVDPFYAAAAPSSPNLQATPNIHRL
ncbi:hypothetical protein DFJ58DRAFT_875324 [Suillus subalutaceus]|uniref:uncharacterized protein n=1 Tax=Suillus subalutaceus TaxID=48586 RepID=UPI001B871C88|nr:uncharacterized protein DFJ58DRAFT_875324 [Suillus subalutaceus]KAG1859594.1 hypothetical protein DFJ58DRAFT_875324 [Suillus subalutaceus]